MAEKFTNISTAVAALYVTVYTSALLDNIIRNSWNISEASTLLLMDSKNTCEMYCDWLSFSPSIHLSNHPPAGPFILPFTYLPTYLPN